jgi:hypothetical protein
LLARSFLLTGNRDRLLPDALHRLIVGIPPQTDDYDKVQDCKKQNNNGCDRPLKSGSMDHGLQRTPENMEDNIGPKMYAHRSEVAEFP